MNPKTDRPTAGRLYVLDLSAVVSFRRTPTAPIEKSA